jgi:hypothetical protein
MAFRLITSGMFSHIQELPLFNIRKPRISNRRFYIDLYSVMLCNLQFFRLLSKNRRVIAASCNSNINPEYNQVGLDDFIPKPFDLESLNKTLRKHIPNSDFDLVWSFFGATNAITGYFQNVRSYKNEDGKFNSIIAAYRFANSFEIDKLILICPNRSLCFLPNARIRADWLTFEFLLF